MISLRMRNCVAAASIAASLGVLLRCASTPPPPRRPPPIVTLPSGPQYAEFVSLPAIVSGHLCGNRERAADWYRFRVENPGRVSLRLQGQTGGTDLDLMLYRNSTDLLSRSASTSPTESIDLDLEMGEYYVKVECYNRKAGTAYVLNIGFTPRRPPPPPAPPPALQPKSDAAIASGYQFSTIGTGAKYRSRWYKYRVTRAGTVEVRFRPNVSGGALKFEIVDERNRTTAEATSSGQDRLVSAHAAPGWLYFRVQTTTTSATGRYSFDVSFTADRVVPQPQPVPVPQPHRPAPQPPPPQPKAHIEPPKAKATTPPPERPRGSATLLVPDRSTGVMLGGSLFPPGDWYKFTVKKPSQVKIVFSGSGHVSASIYAANQSTPIRYGTASSGGLLTDAKYEPGTYEIQVRVSSNTVASGTLRLDVKERNPNIQFEKKTKKP